MKIKQNAIIRKNLHHIKERKILLLTMIKLYIVVLARNTGTVLVETSSSAELTGTDLQKIKELLGSCY